MAELQGHEALAVSQRQAEALWRQALAQHEGGRLDEAARAYRSFLAIWPDHVGALCNLGMLSCQMGAADEALPFLQEATRVAPDIAETHANLGQALKQLGRPEEALASYREAARLQPQNPWCHFNLGVVLQMAGRHEDAMASYREALRLGPRLSRAHNNLGRLLQKAGRADEASACFRRAIEVDPGYFEAHFNLGKALLAAGETEDAASAFAEAAELPHDDYRAINDLGLQLLKLGRPRESAIAFERLAAMKPDNWEAHCNLGSALGRLGAPSEAVASFERAIELRPDSAEAHCNLGVALKNLGRYDEAVASLRKAAEINPEFVDAHNNLGLVLKHVGRLEEAVDCFSRVLGLQPDHHEAHSNMLFTLNLLPGFTAADMLKQARRYGKAVTAGIAPYDDWLVQPAPDKRLRLGLVSGDLRNHPVGFFLEGVLSALNPAEVELYAYASSHHEDELTARIKPRFARWRRVVGMSDEAMARRIRDDAVDILIDLSGHTGYNRLPVFARKPAPVQASWLGYFATTGLAQMDYFLCDPRVVPTGEAKYFSESVWRLPEIYYCFTPPDVAVEPGPLPALVNGHVTFGCFNNLSKMNDAVVRAWAQVLLAVPGAKLMLKAPELNDPAQQRSVRARFAEHGIEAASLELEGSSPRAEYLAAYRKVDIALDPFPYPGGTTSVEGLWMGVPVLTLKGDRFIGHQGETILHNAGLADWIAQDLDDYVARSAVFAGDPGALAELRNGLRAQLLASPVCNAPRFARHFEGALRGMWRKWCGTAGKTM